MNRIKLLSITFIFLSLTFAPSLFGEEGKRTAPLLNVHTLIHFPVTTNSAEAQKFFDQGFILSYGFNHAEAERSFREAARLDPECAMCWWGVALVLGPNINAPMSDEAVPKAHEAVQKALALAPKATERERAYIEAVSKRYAPAVQKDRTALDLAYADAMRQLSKRYPDDLDAALLLAEALMDIHPWDYWLKDGTSRPWTPEILAILESVLKRAPDHQGAIHFHIHAVEASPEPQRGEAYANRLHKMDVTGTSHLAHMPGHLFLRLGRYHDSVVANERALQADQAYITQCHAQGIYPLAYMPHNTHFLWYAALMEGNSAKAESAASHSASQVDHSYMHRPEWTGILQQFSLLPLYGMVRFGKWDQVLGATKPEGDYLYSSGVYHFARGIAFTRKGMFEDAEKELQSLIKLAKDPSIKDQKIWGANATTDLMNIASGVLAGELAAARGQYDEAVSLLKKAAEIEDRLVYIEPPDWFYPVRQSLGAILLQAGRAAEAEEVYRQDLKNHLENGWSLFGLAESLRKQGKVDEAKEVEERFQKAWAHADVKLAASRF